MTQQRLPLPGEQPISVWRPRQRKTSPPSRIPWRLVGAIAGLALAGLGWLIWQASATPVTVVVNGETLDIRTHRLDVNGALVAAGVKAETVVFLDPPGPTPLHPGLVITVGYQRPVIVHADGQTAVVATRQTSLPAILAEAGIALGPGDAVRVERADRPSPEAVGRDPALAAVPALPREIRVVRARTVIVSQGGNRVSFQTAAETVGEALIGAGYTLYEGDFVQPPLDTIIPPEGLEVTFDPGLPVTVHADGQDYALRTHAATVGAALAEIGLAANPPDTVTPPADAPLPAGGVIRLVRVTEQSVIEQTPIPAGTLYVPDPDMELDQTRELQPGADGLQAQQVVIRHEDGVEVSRVVTGRWTARQPQPRLAAYGTRIVIRTAAIDGGLIRFWRKLHVLATSYSPLTAGDKKPGDPRFGISGTGAVVKRGVIAVDPRVIALGTYLYVPGYGPGRALDTGGAVKGLRIDLGYEDPLTRLWNDWIDIYLVLPIPPPDEIRWVLPEN